MKRDCLGDYIVYGSDRVSNDFLYVFPDLNVVFRLSDDDSDQRILETRANYPNAKIIICSFDHSVYEVRMERLNLRYGIDYLYEVDFFALLDDIDIKTKKHIYVWGTGKMAGYFVGECPEIKIEKFVDSNRDIVEFEGYKVIAPEEVNWNDDVFFIVAVAKNREIVEYLQEKGKVYKRDYCIYDDIVGLPSKMLRKTIFDKSYYDVECHTMLNHLEVLTEGNTRCCCTTFVNQNLGNVLLRDMNEVWGSNRHRIMCLSIENHTFSFCDKKMCPLFVGAKKQNVESLNNKEWNYKNPLEKPSTLVAGFDASCNLKCETCRKELYYADERERTYQKRIIDKIENELLKNAKFLVLAGDGEVFASKSYEYIYSSDNCRPDYIRLLTNGTLFNERNWNKLVNGKNCKVMATVSIDAATKDTYEHIRRGGNFDVLCKNMEYASKLKKTGELEYLRMNFVVQRENYKEIPEFIRWGERLGVDEIFFTKILNWGTYSNEEFADVSMMEEDGITPKRALKEILQSDIVRNSKIADLGTIQHGHKVDYNGAVYNYYMWELEKRGGRIFDSI